MTTGKDVLNADMATIGRWAGDGVAWWLAELAAMVPAPVARALRRTGPEVAYPRDGQLVAPAGAAGRPLRGATVLLAPDLVLTRRILLPEMPAQALLRTVRVEADRLLPLPAEKSLLSIRETSRDRAAATIEVEVAALPISRAETLAATLQRHGLSPARIGVAADDGAPAPGHDFLAQLRARGLLAPASTAPMLWWSVVGFLVFLNIGILVWRDQAAVERLQELVEAQRPSVEATRALVGRIERLDRLAAQSGGQRAAHEPVSLLAHLSEILPPGAFLLRLVSDAETVRLSGYAPADIQVATELRASDRLVDVRNVRNEGLAEIAAGKPFDISARVTAPRVAEPDAIAPGLTGRGGTEP